MRRWSHGGPSSQDELYKIFTLKCRQLLEECSLDVNSSTVVSNSKITPVRAVETLLNLYLLHLESNETTPIIDGLIHYSLKIFTRADRGVRDDHDDTEDETSDNPIVDLSTWNMKSTFVVYFRSLFKHFIIKARSIKLPNESKKKNEMELVCTEWLELNELFRKFVSFVAMDQIYTKNVMVTLSSLPPSCFDLPRLGYFDDSSLLEAIHRRLSSAGHADIGSLLPSRHPRHQTIADGPAEIDSPSAITLQHGEERSETYVVHSTGARIETDAGDADVPSEAHGRCEQLSRECLLHWTIEGQRFERQRDDGHHVSSAARRRGEWVPSLRSMEFSHGNEILDETSSTMDDDSHDVQPDQDEEEEEEEEDDDDE